MKVLENTCEDCVKTMGGWKYISFLVFHSKRAPLSITTTFMTDQDHLAIIPFLQALLEKWAIFSFFLFFFVCVFVHVLLYSCCILFFFSAGDVVVVVVVVVVIFV